LTYTGTRLAAASGVDTPVTWDPAQRPFEVGQRSMFEYVTSFEDRPFRKGGMKSTAFSAAMHVFVIGFLVVMPYLYVTDQLPKVPVMTVLVAMPVEPPPPPPPPRPANAIPEAPRPQESTNPNAAPIDAPAAITPESGIDRSGPGSQFGVEGGVEGGIPGGVAGGIVGGLPSAPPPLPPPPAQKPIRIGGQVTAPALILRVEPKYPDFAAQAQIEGLVILEATVDTDGRVQSVEVLRSHGLLDQAAVDAVKQWRYSPLVLNGKPFPFILTVTVRFSVQR
jgi:periplasmic protein TonB